MISRVVGRSAVAVTVLCTDIGRKTDHEIQSRAELLATPRNFGSRISRDLNDPTRAVVTIDLVSRPS